MVLPLNKKTLKPYLLPAARNCHKFAVSTWTDLNTLPISTSQRPTSALAVASGKKVNE